MASISFSGKRLADNTAYHLVRRAQASIASYQHFRDGDLSQYLERESFMTVAAKLTDKFFHKSGGLQFEAQVRELYVVLQIMAPILQRLPLSFKFDWHCGHLLSFVRTHASGRIRRHHVAIRQVERSYQPVLLAANLEAIGIHDATMTEVLQDLYRRHCGGTTLQHRLAHQLFDPIILASAKCGHELRFGNQLLRIEKSPFDGSTDLRREPINVLDYSLCSVEHPGGYHLEIKVAESCINDFKQHIERIMDAAASPDHKVSLLRNRINDFVERTRSARSGKAQMLELKRWLANKVRRLSGTAQDARLLSELLINQWLQRVDPRLYIKAPNFFFDHKQHDESVYTTFFSPYREG